MKQLSFGDEEIEQFRQFIIITLTNEKKLREDEIISLTSHEVFGALDDYYYDGEDKITYFVESLEKPYTSTRFNDSLKRFIKMYDTNLNFANVLGTI